MAAHKDFYRTLQVSSEASAEVIDAAYRSLARKYHPDVNKNRDATAKMQEINEAYEILRDPSARAAYDDQVARASRTTPGATNTSPPNPPARETPSTPQSPIPADFPVHCWRCGRSDATLRLATFPWVVSIVILTFRRAWCGIYCAECREHEMQRAKIRTALFGWWGLPFGVIFTIGALATPSDGQLPKEENAEYLRQLCTYFLWREEWAEAKSALQASLSLKNDPRLAEAYRSMFGEPYGSDNGPQPHSDASPTEGDHFAGPKPERVRAAPVLAWIVIVGLVFAFLGYLQKQWAVPERKPEQGVSLPSPESATVNTRPVPTPTRRPPLATPRPPVPGWEHFSNIDLRIGGYLPSSYHQDRQNQANAPEFDVWLLASDGKGGALTPAISVQAIPREPTDQGKQVPVSDLFARAKKRVEAYDAAILMQPRITTVGGLVGGWLIAETRESESGDAVRFYQAFVLTHRHFYEFLMNGRDTRDADLESFLATFLQAITFED